MSLNLGVISGSSSEIDKLKMLHQNAAESNAQTSR